MPDPDPEKFLAELAIGVAKGITSSIKDNIKKYWLKCEYGITLNPQEGNSLKTIANNEFYQLFKRYLGEHWSLKLIKVGLYLSELNEEGKRERAGEIQKEAYQKYGSKGAKIIHLASTGILIPIMDYIIDLKLHKGASCIVLNQEFDKILDEWDKISIPVHWDSKETSLENEIKNKMENNYPIFFVYASGSASRIAQFTLAKMNNANLFRNRYIMTHNIKIVVNTEYCIWVFEKIQDIQDSIISKQIIK